MTNHKHKHADADSSYHVINFSNVRLEQEPSLKPTTLYLGRDCSAAEDLEIMDPPVAAAPKPHHPYRPA